jgi:hypothetical protein
MLRLRPRVASTAQRIVLAAPHNQTFTQCLEATENINKMFRMEYPSGAMKIWKPKTTDGFPTIDFATRYLSMTNSEPEVKIPEDVDPRRILLTAAPDNARHTAENIVKYYERTLDEDGVET